MMVGARATVGDTDPCTTCGHVKDVSKRLHEIACCGLENHRVYQGIDFMRMAGGLAHLWLETNEYSAVERREGISEEDALAWLERAHAGKTPRRERIEGALADFDRWED